MRVCCKPADCSGSQVARWVDMGRAANCARPKLGSQFCKLIGTDVPNRAVRADDNLQRLSHVNPCRLQ